MLSWSAAAARKVSAAPRITSLPSATRTRASLPTVVVLPVPLTPTTRTTAGTLSRPAVGAPCSGCGRASGRRARESCSRSSARTCAGSLRPSTRTRVRRASMSSVGPAPTSARSRVSSSSSQSSSVRWSRESTASRRAPSGEPDRARRSRSRASRPATGAGTSRRPGARRRRRATSTRLRRRAVGRVASTSRRGRGAGASSVRGVLVGAARGGGGRATGRQTPTSEAGGRTAARGYPASVVHRGSLSGGGLRTRTGASGGRPSARSAVAVAGQARRAALLAGRAASGRRELSDLQVRRAARVRLASGTRRAEVDRLDRGVGGRGTLRRRRGSAGARRRRRGTCASGRSPLVASAVGRDGAGDERTAAATRSGQEDRDEDGPGPQCLCPIGGPSRASTTGHAQPHTISTRCGAGARTGQTATTSRMRWLMTVVTPSPRMVTP